MNRIIAHLDMDAFFAAIEERDKPWLAGLPVVVGADPQEGSGRGVVSTANYAARKYGIHSAMPISTAWRLAEEGRKNGGAKAIFIQPNGRRYGEISAHVFAIVRSFVPVIEQASVDEAYLDLSDSGSYEKAVRLCRAVKGAIKAKEHLTASIGVGPNKLVAKIASDRQKPDGLTVIRPKEVPDFLAPLPVRTIPGIGPKAEGALRRDGVRTIADLRRYSREELISMFGKWGGGMYARARGEDDSPVHEEHETKSVGEQETFSHDLRDPADLIAHIKGLSEGVHRRFSREGFAGFRTIVLTVRFDDFETVSRSHTLSHPASSRESIEFEALKLFLPFLDGRENPKKKSIRLLGVRVEKFLVDRIVS